MVSAEQVGNKQVILIKVWAGSKQPYIFDGSIFFRRGQNTIKATSVEISDLIHNRQKAELHWERQVALGVELEDLDIYEIQKTIDHSINESKLDESKRNPIDFLTHFGLFQNGHFINAAVVLFAKNPAWFIPQMRVRVAFPEKGKTADEFIDDKLLEGSLFKKVLMVSWKVQVWISHHNMQLFHMSACLHMVVHFVSSDCYCYASYRMSFDFHHIIVQNELRFLRGLL